MPSCVVPTCKNAAGLKKKQDGITFHVFPADEERKAVWTKIIQRARLEELWKPSKQSVVCSMHFEDKYIYETKCGLKRLKKEAFPNKHLAIIVEESGSCMEKSKKLAGDRDLNSTNESTDPGVSSIPPRKLAFQAVDEEDVAMDEADNSGSRSMSSNALDNVNNRNIEVEPILETPRETFLKEKLNRLSMRSRRLLLDNNNLKKKNKRLTMTCKRLKESVNQYKKIIKSMVNK